MEPFQPIRVEQRRSNVLGNSRRHATGDIRMTLGTILLIILIILLLGGFSGRFGGYGYGFGHGGVGVIGVVVIILLILVLTGRL
tara:strand:+ start:3019 stop:3270 length:252 start_codon:yes stop_codon:yes gene_type:complete